MMRAAVFFQAVADVGLVPGPQWVVGPDRAVDLGYVRRIFNCYEESALELALGLADQSRGLGRSLELTAVTLDGAVADGFLRTLLAVGYAQAVRIEPRPGVDGRFAPQALARVLAAQARAAGVDLALLGRQGGVGDSGQTGYLVAEALGWPCVRQVSALAPDPEPGWLRVASHTAAGVLTQSVRPPVVLVVGDSLESPYLRVPTLKQKLAAGKKAITVLEAAGLGLDPVGAPVAPELLDLRPAPARPPCAWLPGGNPAEQARALHDLLRERLDS